MSVAWQMYDETSSTFLLGMIGLTLDSQLNDEQRQQLSIAYDSGKVLVALLNDILDLSKFEAGKLQLEQIPATRT